MRYCLVLLGIALPFDCKSVHHCGTALASEVPENQAQYPGKTEKLGFASTWQAKVSESEAGIGCLATASYLESTGIFELGEHQHDVGMQLLSGCKPATSRVLSDMQKPLERSMGQQEEEKSKPPYSQGEASQATGCQGPSGCRRVDAFHRKSSMDNDNSKFANSSTCIFMGRGTRSTSATSAATAATTSATSSEGRILGGRFKSNEILTGTCQYGDRTVDRTARDIEQVGKATPRSRSAERIVAWPFEQTRQGETSVESHCDQDRCSGYGVGEVHDWYYHQGDEPCTLVSELSCPDAGDIPSQAQRARSSEEGYKSSVRLAFGQHGTTSTGGRSPEDRRPDSGTQGCNGRSHTGNACTRDSPRDFRRRNGTRVDQRQRDGQGGKGKTECQERWHDVQRISIAKSCRKSSPQSQTDSEATGRCIDSSGPVSFPHVQCLVGSCTRTNDRNESDVSGEFHSSDDAQDATFSCLSSWSACGKKQDFDEVQFFEDVSQKCKESELQVRMFLEDQWPWMCEQSATLSSSLHPQSKLLSFDSKVDVCIMFEGNCMQYQLDQSRIHRVLRNCWSLEGGDSSFARTTEVLQHDMTMHSRGVEHESAELLTSFVRNTNDRPPDEPDADPNKDEWVLLQDESLSRTRPVRIETWFLRRDEFEVCVRSRSVTVMPDVSQDMFERQCLQEWFDYAGPEPIQWHVVRNAPANNPGVKAHVIVTQNLHENQAAHLIHWDRWPVLYKFRAVAFQQASVVKSVLDKVRFDGNPIPMSAQYGMHYNDQGRVQHLDQNDEVELRSAAVLYAYLQHLPVSDASDLNDTDGTASNETYNASTDVPSEDETSAEGDEVSWVADLALHSCFDQYGPYPWEDEDPPQSDDEVEEAEMIPTLDFAPRDQNQMQQQALYIRANPDDNSDSWVAVTFGLGLVHLGRRDLSFRWEELPDLKDKIRDLWQDHMQYGRADLFFITPQPEGLHTQKYLAFIIAMDYGFVDLEDRKVLVRERSPDASTIASQPYTAVLRSFMSPAGILQTLDHTECYPFGVRNCHVRMAGRWVNERAEHIIMDGDLCDIYIDDYPQYIENAEDMLGNAEQLFRIARSYFDSIPGAVQFVLRTHGISPQNQPMGHRDLITDYPDLTGLSWMARMRTLWPFDEQTAACWFVPSGDFQLGELTDRPILHFIVSYVTDPSRCPIMVRQTMFEAHTMRQFHELHAVAIPRDASEAVVRRHLNRPPFWFMDEVVTHLKRYDQRIDDTGQEWEAADVLNMQFNVLSMEYMLKAMWLMSQRVAEQTLEYETASLLQISQNSFVNTDELMTSSSQNENGFDEICIECMQQVVKLQTVRSEEDLEQAPAKVDQSCHNQRVQPDHHSLQSKNLHIIQDIDHDLDAIFNQTWQGLNVNFERIHDLHPMAQAALKVIGQRDELTNTFHVFTDGSAKGGAAAWAFVVIAESCYAGHSAFHMIGYTGNSLSDDIGPFNPTSLDAEATAIIGATEYLLSRRFPTDMKVNLHLHFDCTAVGWGSFGKQNVVRQKGDSQRQEDARIMLSLLQAKQGVAGHHVHAHQGQPWNEMADSVASWIRCGGTCSVIPVLKCASLLKNKWKKWAWMQVHPSNECPDLGTILSKVEIAPIESGPDSSFAQITPEIERDPNVSKRCTLKIATFNAGTFEYGKEQGNQPTGHKVREIMHQLDTAQYDIVAVQETRAKHDQVWTEGPYIRFISAGNSGQAGVELWVHEYQLASKLQRPIQASDFTVWHNDSRLLCVHFALDVHGLDIVVCYAPQGGRADEEITAFWDHCTSVLQQRSWQAPVWFMGDVNGKIGCIESEAVGSLAADMEDLGGQCFHRLCSKFNWIVPATFAKWHQGPSNTFVSARGYETRVDFIAVDEIFEEGIQSSFVDDQIDLLNGDIDHKLLALELTFVQKGHMQEGYSRKPWYDRHEAKKQCEQGCPALANLHEIHWNKAATEHWDKMRDHLQFTMARWFPCKKRQKRQLYFSDDSWKLVCHRKDLRMEFRRLQRDRRWLLLQRCFIGWCKRGSEIVTLSNLHCHHNKMQLALTFEARRKTDEAFKTQKRIDWKCWAEHQIDKRLQEAQFARGSEIFRILRPKQAIAKHAGKTRKPLPGLQDGDGVWKRSQHDVALAWQAQFSAIENAEATTIQDLRNVECPGSTDCSIDMLLDIPDVFDLERALRQLNSDKAAGFDGLGAEIFKGDPAQAASRLFPLLLKMSLRGEWPAEFSGGWSLPLFKHKGSSKQMQGYRAIMLEPSLARAYSRAWRPFLLKGLQKISAVNQWGGRRGLGISALHLHLRMAQQTAHKQRNCLALIFLDLKSAFYSVAKPLLSKWSGDVSQLYDLCHTLGIPNDAADAFIEHVENSDCIAKATGSTLTAQMVQASLARTWFVIPNSNQLCAPKTGSRPGDPLADVLFAYIMSAVLDNIQERMENAQLIDFCDDHQMLPSQMVTWVDDVAINISGPADKIVNRTMQTFCIVNQVITEYGMTLSMGPGKSAVILSFAGRGAVAARQDCEQKHGQYLTVLNEYCGSSKLPIVSHYKHLGGHIVRNGALLPEVKIRAAQATSRLKPLRYITKDKRIALEKRQMMIKSLTLPVLTLHCGTWSNLGKQEFQAWSGALFRLYTAMQGRDTQGNYETISFYQAAHDMQSPMPMELLHLHKLRLAFQIMEHGDEAIFSSIILNWRAVGSDSWLEGVKRSLTWLLEQTDAQDLQVVCGNLHDIETWRTRKKHVRRLKKLLKQAEGGHLLRVRALCELQHTDKLQKQTFLHMGWNVERAVSQEPGIEQWRCDECNKMFPNPASLSVHEQKKHGKRIAIRRFLTDGACRACGRFFHTRARAIQHVHYSHKGCWHFHLRWLLPMSEEEAKILDDQACQEGEAWHHHGLRAHCKDQQWRPCTESEMTPTLVEKMDKMQVTRDEPTDDEISEWGSLGILPVGQGGKQRTVRKHKVWDIYNVVEDLVKFERDILEETDSWDTEWTWVPPELPYNARFYLILFSGHRRHEDIACWATWADGVFPVSIDTAIHKTHGNLHNIGFWVHLIVSGLVIGAHGAPPCETFSLARWLEMLDSLGRRIGPRPLRDTDHPWGVPFRTLREVRQGVVGSILMAKTLQILMLVYYFGGCFSMEHPRGPAMEDLPWGIWNSGYVKRLKKLAQVGLVHFIQGPLGVPFFKPTVIIQGRLPHLAMAIYGAYDLSWRCTEVLGGLQEDTLGWRTSKAKAYPSTLCKILAQQTAWYASTVSRSGWADESTYPQAKEIIAALTKPWDAYTEDCDRGMLNDFQMDAFV